MQKIAGEIQISASRFAKIEKEIKNIPEFRDKVKNTLTKPVTELAEIILGGALNLEASDIHIEPRETETKIRVRIDGFLQDVLTFPLNRYPPLLSRIKLLSGIKLNITDRPQDGRFSISINDLLVEIRASTLPTEYGESIALRVLNPKTLIEIENLGLRKDLLEIFKTELKKTTGMIIVTGPTGSGKTTTLYAFLKKIKKPEIKIITIEDPIEYHLKGISQTQVAPKKGYDFASGLRSIVRQDPDVILVGEIRDTETSQIAIQAALTGHLVLTTLHTNDAAGTVARLVSLKARPSNIGPALNVAIAQRLIRRVCRKCSKLEKPSPQEIKKFKNSLNGILPILKKQGIKIPEIGNEIPRAKGCRDCNFMGYRSRIGIFEVILFDEEMEKFILKNPSIAALREKALKKGMITMQQDGLIKVLQGITTIEEVERITGPIR